MLRSLWLAVVLAAAGAGIAQADEIPASLADRLAPLLPAVVNIETVTSRADRPYYFWGSGFVVEASGMIVTNRHVIAGADKITVTGINFPPQQATLIYVSDILDLAMLKVDVGKPLPALQFADSDHLRIGEPVFAMGNPLGVGLSVSAGIVSALNRNIRETIYDDFIQTDAAINHGNSGGPLLDASGKVVGIDTALYSSPHNTGSIGLGFALPANDAKFIVDQVIRFGEVRAGWAGLDVQPMTQALADGLGLGQARGVVVTRVDRGGPAAAGTVAVGDVVLAIAGQTVTAATQVRRVIAEAAVGQPMTLDVLRDGAERTVTLTIAAYPKDTAVALHRSKPPFESRVAMATAADPGMQLAPLTPAERRRYGIAATDTGVLVAEVSPLGAAAHGGIVAGDLILRVRQRVVGTPADVHQALAALAGRQPEQVALLVQGSKDTHWVVLPLAPEHAANAH